MINLFKKGFIYLVLMLLVLGSFSVESASAAEAVDYEEGVTNLNNTPENSAVVGSRLLKPEIGWKRYDDSNLKIEYLGNVLKNQNSLSYNSGYSSYMLKHPYNNELNGIKFNFTGTKFRLIAAQDSVYRSNNIVIEIDGVTERFNQTGAATKQTLVFEKTGLNDKQHSVFIYADDKTSKVGYDRTIRFDIDAIDVDGELVNISSPESITFDKNNLELFEGNTEKLTATVTSNNTNVIWTSSDESIAIVDQNGKVTAIKEGVVTVTAQVENTNLIAECIVTVKKQGSTELESITLDRNILELLEGSQDKLTATTSPENAKVIWSSSDESIAMVDQNGNVTAIREGQAIITAKVENTELVATATVIVKKPVSESSSAILSITLVNGITKEYDVTNAVLNNYLNWFDSAQGTATFKFSKTISPYKKVTEYVVHDKIASFEVREY